MASWASYYHEVGTTPNSLVRQALECSLPTKREVALDLGAGNFRDCLFLQCAGFKRIIAIDTSPDIPAVPAGIEYERIRVEDYELGLERFDFILSCNTLFFIPKEKVMQLFSRVNTALRPDGVFACNFLGERDQWVTRGSRNVSFFTEDDVSSIASCFEGMTAEDVGEQEYGGSTASGIQKHWHLRSIIYQRT